MAKSLTAQNRLTLLNAEKEKYNPLYIRVKVIPRSSNNEITDILSDGTYKIRINAPPEKNKANKLLCKFLSQNLKITLNNIKIIAGHTEQVKLIKICNKRWKGN